MAGPTMDARKSQIISDVWNGMSLKDIYHKFDISESGFRKWRYADAEFDAQLKEALAAKMGKGNYSIERTVFDPNRESPPKGTFAEWQMRYTGFPTLPHHQAIADAMLDTTNNRTLILMPPDAGKDTTVSRVVAYIKCDDRNHRRVAWIMKTEPFSKRRVQERLRPLFESYKPQPTPGIDVPGGRKPEGVLAEDYGPFRWTGGMQYPDGTPIPRRTWNNSELYFLDSAEAGTEVEPDIWATGIGGQLYGSRITDMVVSDLWDEEDRNPEQVLQDLTWLKGTARSRVGGTGRITLLGTELPDNEGYRKVREWFVPEDTAIYERSVEGPVEVTKYVNGACIIEVKAIWTDDEGVEHSYWPERFPLHDYWKLADGSVADKSAYTIAEARELGAMHGEGLASIRDNPSTAEWFQAAYMQNPSRDKNQADFNDEVLALCDDYERTHGIARSNEILVQVIDPARRDGACWMVLGVNMEDETITVIDHEWYRNLGVQGIKQKLVIEPMMRYFPSFVVYESNHEQGIMFDAEVERALKLTGAQRELRHTDNKRNDPEIGIVSMTSEMMRRLIRFPMREPMDKAKSHRLKQQLKNWDRVPKSQRKNQARHSPDDLAMALGIGVQFVRSLFTRAEHARKPAQRRPLPGIVTKGWQRTPKNGKVPSSNDPYPEILSRRNGIVELLGIE